MEISDTLVSYIGSPTMDDKDNEGMSRSSVVSSFRAKEEEIEKMKMAIRGRVQAQLGRVEEESKRLAEIREEVEALQVPMKKEVAFLRKRIDIISKELKPLGIACQKKEREYKELLDVFNNKTKEKTQLVAKLMEMIAASEKLRLEKLEELNKHVESLN